MWVSLSPSASPRQRQIVAASALWASHVAIVALRQTCAAAKKQAVRARRTSSIAPSRRLPRTRVCSGGTHPHPLIIAQRCACASAQLVTLSTSAGFQRRYKFVTKPLRSTFASSPPTFARSSVPARVDFTSLHRQTSTLRISICPPMLAPLHSMLR